MKFALTSLVKQRKLTFIYGLTITLITMVCYIFLGMLYDPYMCLDTSDMSKMYMGAGTTLLIVMFSVCLMCYTSVYVIESKNKEISLMIFHGMTLKKMTFYQIYQNTLLYFVFGLLGIIAGYILTPYIIQFIYSQIHQSDHVVIGMKVFYQTVYMVIVMYVISLVVNIGYVYRGRLLSMMSNTRQNKYRKKNTFRLPNMAYIIIFLAGIIMMLTTEHVAVGYIVFAVIGGIGGYGMTRYTLPEYIEKKKSSTWLNDSQKLIVFGELFLKLKFIGLFLQLLILVSIIVTTIICYNFDNQVEMYRMIIAYLITIPMIIFCITYKNIIISKKNSKNLSFVYKLGIVKQNEKKLIQKEFAYLYGLLLLLPLIYMIPTLVRFYIFSNMSLQLMIILVLYFIMNLFISMVISYQSSIQFLKEA